MQDFTKQEQALIAIAQQFLQEMHIERALHRINLNTYLDRDLGIDSIGKAELIDRIEKHFHIEFPQSIIAEAETLKDIVAALPQAKPEQPFSLERKHPVSDLIDIKPQQASTLVEVLSLYGEKLPHRTHIYLQEEDGSESIITYGELLTQAKKIAAGLIELGLKPTETVAIMLPTCCDFFYTFMGILLAGGVPVPMYPPLRPDRIGEYATRESLILKNAEVRFLITFQQAEALSRLLRFFIPSLKAVLTVNDLRKIPGKSSKIKITGGHSALIQYTSGSTSTPKGVLLTHNNLLANIHAYGEAIHVRPNDQCVSWLPLYHDMGLIGAWLGSFYYGVPVTIMSPLAFLARPEKWLWSIHYYRGTVSAGPNFAYELCVNKIDDNDIKGLDLSSWRLAFNGAEAVNPNTLRRFIKKFEPYGFNKKHLFPVYGLAECSVALTFPPLERGIRIDKIEREAFEKKLRAIPTTSTHHALEFVSCGVALNKHKVRVVDNKNHILPDRHIGNLQFSGPSAMQGYYRNNQATEAAYHDGWWDTGDLAYLVEGEVFITGRKKDIIIKAGRNIHPEEIEQAASQVEGVRKGCVVAFGVRDEKLSTEKLILVAETKAQQPSQKQAMINAITDKITIAVGIPPDAVILVTPHIIPKTSSGKLRRSSCKQAYIKGELNKFTTPVWLQLSKLFIRSLYIRTLRLCSKLLKFLFSLYLGMVLMILLLPIWSTVMPFPQPQARKIAKIWARILFLLAFCPITTHRKEKTTLDQPAIYCSNHMSYLDAAVLIAVLPTNISIVAKAELLTTPLLRGFVRKLGHLVIERFNFRKSIADTEKIQAALANGTSIAIFPEGTFTYASGLRPFKSGAFKMAAATQSPIIPIAIKGTRPILREALYLFHPHSIVVTFLPPMTAHNNSWEEINRLKKEVRHEIAKYCGEELINA